MTKSELQDFINLLPFKDKVNAGEMHELELNTRFINVNRMTDAARFTNPGIRFYFGLIDDTFIENGITKACLRLTTILVPTTEVDLGASGKINQDTLLVTSIAGRAFDHGDLCPPKCNGSDYENFRI